MLITSEDFLTWSSKWCTVIWATNQLSDRQLDYFWTTHFGQLGDNIGRVVKDVDVGKIFEIISF